MTDESIYINSLRLSRLGGGSNSKIVPPYPFIQWFYNGSTRFEEDVNNPRVFNDLSGAVSYFTEKLQKTTELLVNLLRLQKALDEIGLFIFTWVQV